MWKRKEFLAELLQKFAKITNKIVPIMLIINRLKLGAGKPDLFALQMRSRIFSGGLVGHVGERGISEFGVPELALLRVGYIGCYAVDRHLT